MLKIRTLSDCRRRGFEGSVDADIDISLYEYGLIHKQEKDGRFLFIYGFGTDSETGNFNTFDYAHFDEDDFEDIVSSSWFSLEGILRCVGMTEEQWKSLPLQNRVSDLISYYGNECVFGSAGEPFGIGTQKRHSSTV